jgi:hypothetical protein
MYLVPISKILYLVDVFGYDFSKILKIKTKWVYDRKEWKKD